MLRLVTGSSTLAPYGRESFIYLNHMELLLATGNQHKARAIELILDRPIKIISLDLPEIQSIHVSEVIEEKAKVAFDLIGQPVLVEDTSLSVHAWNNLPGALIKWFLESVGNDGICQMLQSYEKLEATAETCIGYFNGQQFISFSGLMEGYISRQPKGENGFGWDPIFIPDGWDKTIAEMSNAEKEGFVSMRSRATLKLKTFLDKGKL
ncbi:MAG: non-canonical purine NTP pyrophosphatase [Chloroflexota bacterium]